MKIVLFQMNIIILFVIKNIAFQAKVTHFKSKVIHFIQKNLVFDSLYNSLHAKKRHAENAHMELTRSEFMEDAHAHIDLASNYAGCSG